MTTTPLPRWLDDPNADRPREAPSGQPSAPDPYAGPRRRVRAYLDAGAEVMIEVDTGWTTLLHRSGRSYSLRPDIWERVRPR